MSNLRPVLALPLMFLLACSGGGGGGDAPAAPASGLSYADPAGVPATAYALRRNQALSAPASHLVLDLYGPASPVTGSGVVLTLNLDAARASWAPVAGQAPVANGSVFADNLEGPPVVVGRITGAELQVVVMERGTASAKPLTGPLLQIALDLNPGQSAGVPVTLPPDLARSQVQLGTVKPMPDLRVGVILTR